MKIPPHPSTAATALVVAGCCTIRRLFRRLWTLSRGAWASLLCSSILHRRQRRHPSSTPRHPTCPPRLPSKPSRLASLVLLCPLIGESVRTNIDTEHLRLAAVGHRHVVFASLGSSYSTRNGAFDLPRRPLGTNGWHGHNGVLPRTGRLANSK